MACCGKVKRTKKTVVLVSESAISYVEGQDGYITVNYLDSEQIRIKGCKSRHVYLFADYGQYKIDSNDASCLFDSKPGLFEEVIEDATASDNCESEDYTTESESDFSERDDRFLEID